MSGSMSGMWKRSHGSDSKAPFANQVADHDAVGVPLANRDFIDADRLRTGYPGAPDLLGHVLLVQRLDRVPVKLEFLGDIAHGRLSTAASDVPGKPLRVKRVVGQPVDLLALHLAARSAVDPAHLERQPEPGVAARQVADLPELAVVPARLRAATAPADCFFPRRTSVTTRALGSPNTPLTVACGRKPGNR